MADATLQRSFTAARIRRRAKASSNGSGANHGVDDNTAEARHREMMAAITALGEHIDGYLAVRSAPQPSPADAAAAADETAQPPDAEGTEAADQLVLRQELARLSQAIEQTKREIAALRLKKDPPDALVAASNELDAVVQATESATDTILGAAERIEELINQLRNQSSGEEETATLDEVSEQVIAMFEACNFQDITGQRITKVINAMKFIEERVEQMISIMGGAEAFAGIEIADPATDANEDEDRKLMNGPAADPELAISQDDIDKMFS